MSSTDPREQRPVWPPETERPGGPSKPEAPAAPSSSSPSPSAGADAPGHRRTRAGGAGTSGAALAIATLVLGLVLGAAGMQLLGSGDDDHGATDALVGHIDEAGFQAVILTNDKVYFGRLREVNDAFFRLDDAFFLRETRASEDAPPVREPVPVNEELHGPENSILIRQDEVVLVEDLDRESTVFEQIQAQVQSQTDDNDN